MMRFWLSDEQAVSLIVLVSRYLSQLKSESNAEHKEKWQQIYDMLGTQYEQQKTDDTKPI